MKLFMYLIALWALYFLTGCATAPSTQTQERIPWEFDSLVQGGVSPSLAVANPGDLCPTDAVPRLAFWSALWRATAEKESSMNPATNYTEKDDNVSRGLVQISYSDEGRGPHCKNLKATIYDPATNLLCGLDIADELVRKARYPTLRQNLGRYWSTIRDHKVDALLEEYVPECFYKKMDPEMMEGTI